MPCQPETDKDTVPGAVSAPRMMGDTDVELVRAYAGALSSDARLIEFGPFLGGVSAELARLGELHVVDRFVWTEANDTAYPGLAEAGGSFRPLFERMMSAQQAVAISHETSFRDFEWNGGPLDFCLMDGPRTPRDLLKCLAAIAPALRPEAPVLIKHGVGVNYPGLTSLVEMLLTSGAFRLAGMPQPAWCNIAALLPGPNIGSLTALEADDDLFATNEPGVDTLDPWGGAQFVMARVVERIAQGDWTTAYAFLACIPGVSGIPGAWDQFTAALPEDIRNDERLALFSEFVTAQSDLGLGLVAPYRADRSLASCLRSYWISTAGASRLDAGLSAQFISVAFASGGMARAEQLRSLVEGRHLIEIGCDLLPGSIGYLCVGAERYSGFAVDDLTADMLKAEAHFEPIKFLPLASLDAGAITKGALVLVHSDIARQTAVRDMLRKIRTTAATPVQIHEI